ncbi:MAG: hypothetical protein V1779_04240 [bacterium]
METKQDELITNLVKGRNDSFIELRKNRIDEAISFKSGTIKKQRKVIICKLPNDKEVFFLKPGKETTRKKPNIHDMWPGVGINSLNEFAGYSFDTIWEHLIKIGIINQITLKKVLILLYRICYMLDHTYIGKNRVRYNPNKDIIDYIKLIDYSIKEGYNDKFKTQSVGLMEYLHFVDLLGWNEDVKYHVTDNKPDFETKKKETGRVNTILSVISVPIMINEFVMNIIKNVENIEKIDIKLILSTMQKLTKTRGICVLAKKDLVKYLSPYLQY